MGYGHKGGLVHSLLFTDECAMNVPMRKGRWVWRREKEQHHIKKVRPKFKKLGSCMVWGGISGLGQGPLLLWKHGKPGIGVRGQLIGGWGTLNAESYCQRVFPLIWDHIVANPEQLLVEDNSSVHNAAEVLA
ncbi:hypothetical protein Dda_6989 [Drechslerella dactyloides]|uniref:Tc1-like transposase DDE domain-containing protein n=1 Tax=Drechslerella dactyloides TaxID=74499 RepID=A0AAD6IWM5_DREDA|nr:hypothetical protein Dda_6989 [Drechslerella dactyloides]